MKQKIINWWKRITREEWELTIMFAGETRVLADGTRIESTSPETFGVKKIKKLSPKHFVFVDLEGVPHEYKLINPVSYAIKKIW